MGMQDRTSRSARRGERSDLRASFGAAHDAISVPVARRRGMLRWTVDAATVTVLQRGLGNAAVVQLLADSTGGQHRTPVLRQAEPAPVGANPLEGLRRGDGLDLGTSDRRPRVRLLQSKLNEQMLAELVIDGMFGRKTSETLAEYQLSIRVTPSQPIDRVTAESLNPTEGPGSVGLPTSSPATTASHLAVAGGALSRAGAGMFGASSGLSQAGRLVTLRRGGLDVEAGSLLEAAGTALGQGGPRLMDAGVLLLQESRDRLTRRGGAGPGNPLVGLKRGDGLVFGTFDRRVRVRLLQERLNDRTQAALVIDGMFGPLTGGALMAFQSSVGQAEQEIVDPDTADLLLGRQHGDLADDSGLVQAGSDLLAAATRGFTAGTALQQAAISVAAGGDSTDPETSQQLSGSASALIAASTALGEAGSSLLSLSAGGGDPPSENVATCGQLLQLGGFDAETAGDLVLSAGSAFGDPTSLIDPTVGASLGLAGSSLVACGTLIRTAGDRLASVQSASAVPEPTP